MLVLSRKADQGVTIRTPEGREIHVCLVELRGERARIGFTADDDVTIHRDEIQSEIDREARHADR
jgi:carbon storage regulator